jgi:hypothetical protein
MPDDPFDDLRDRLKATQDAAERLVNGTPAQGWAAASDEQRNQTAQEVQALLALLHALRDVVPPELWDEVREVVRRLLLLVRALLDFVAERLEPGRSADGPSEAPPVEDIPIA